jgi:hypothetical protein
MGITEGNSPSAFIYTFFELLLKEKLALHCLLL